MNRSGRRLQEICRHPWFPVGVLGLAMAASFACVMYVGRGATFSGDEMAWIAAMPGFDLHQALEPHGGHLVLVSRATYRVMLELFGLDYAPYRALSALTLLVTVGLLFAWLRRRLDPLVALAPCLVLLFFGSDHIHLLQGNGFTVAGSIALGLAALLALEREDRAGDVAACALLVIGVLTYTVAIPFAFCAGLVLLSRPGSRSRAWVALVPLAVYLLWRLWVLAAVDSNPGGEIALENALLIPAWIFQSVSGLLNSLTGMGYDFQNGGPAGAGEMAGPPLAVAALALIGWRVSRGRLDRWFWGVALLGLVLWGSQALAYDDGAGARLPGGDSRYLLPGAVALLMIGAEAARTLRFSRAGLVALAVVAASGVATNVMLLRDAGAIYRSTATQIEAVAGVGSLVRGMSGHRPEPRWNELGSQFGVSTFALSGLPYGEYGIPVGELADLPEDLRQMVDGMTATGEGLGLAPADAACDAPALEPGAAVELPFGTVLLDAGEAAVPVSLARFADTATVQLGEVPPGAAVTLTLPRDASARPWRLIPGAPGLSACRQVADRNDRDSAR